MQPFNIELMDSSKRLQGLLSGQTFSAAQQQAKTLDSNRVDTSDAGFLKDTTSMIVTGQNFAPSLNKASSNDALKGDKDALEIDEMHRATLRIGPQHSTGSNSNQQLPKLKSARQESLTVVEEETVMAHDTFVTQADSKRSKFCRIFCCLKKSKEQRSPSLNLDEDVNQREKTDEMNDVDQNGFSNAGVEMTKTFSMDRDAPLRGDISNFNESHRSENIMTSKEWQDSNRALNQLERSNVVPRAPKDA